MNMFLFYINFLRFVPHIIVYMIWGDKVKPDMSQWENVVGCNPWRKRGVMSFCWMLYSLQEYRSLVYYRLGLIGKVLNVFASQMPTCYLTGTLSKNIGCGIVIHHGHSMRLGAQRVGENFQIWHNVTVGKSKSGGVLPVIGDNVKIFTGAVVVGDICIGNNVTIGACTFVSKSVPDGCVVVGNPARIVRRNGVRCDELL